jgi:hypothetical protein
MSWLVEDRGAEAEVRLVYANLEYGHYWVKCNVNLPLCPVRCFLSSAPAYVARFGMRWWPRSEGRTLRVRLVSRGAVRSNVLGLDTAECSLFIAEEYGAIIIVIVFEEIYSVSPGDYCLTVFRFAGRRTVGCLGQPMVAALRLRPDVADLLFTLPFSLEIWTRQASPSLNVPVHTWTSAQSALPTHPCAAPLACESCRCQSPLHWHNDSHIFPSKFRGHYIMHLRKSLSSRLRAASTVR